MIKFVMKYKNKYRKYFNFGKSFFENRYYTETQKNEIEFNKSPYTKIDIINFLLSKKEKETFYLEIGLRDPNHNFNHILADKKFSVDPGFEVTNNLADFKVTSDDFFKNLKDGNILFSKIKFDVILIDGLHLAEQADRDISNSLNYLNDNGFIIVHDCNPPSQWHARETYDFHCSPAGGLWYGTTWKAFVKYRFNPSLYSCCIKCDAGVGIISKDICIGKSIDSSNNFYEYSVFAKKRSEYLNLISFENFKNIINKISL